MQLAIGIPLPSAQAAYFEIVSLDDIQSTLESLGVSLVGASLVTTLAGAALGFWAARRALRPLTEVSAAATAIAAGRLDTRLEASDDPDLRPRLVVQRHGPGARRTASSATPASRPTSATSSGRRS